MSKLNSSKKLTAFCITFALVLGMLIIPLFKPATVQAADEPMDQASERGWIDGGDLSPDALITRGEFADMLWRAMGSPAPKGECPFTDIDDDAFYRDAVTALYEAGVIAGYGDGIFGGNDYLTREMGFVMLARYWNLSPTDTDAYTKFADADQISDWARSAISAMVELGYFSGTGDNRFAPGSSMTLAETAASLIRVVDGETERGEEPPAEDDGILRGGVGPFGYDYGAASNNNPSAPTPPTPPTPPASKIGTLTAGVAGVAEVKGTWTLEITTPFETGETITINGESYEYVDDSPSGKQFIGATKEEQATNLAALLDSDLLEFNVSANDGVITFEQETAGTGAEPTASTSAIGRIDGVTPVKAGVAAADSVQGTWTLEILEAFVDGDILTIDTVDYVCDVDFEAKTTAEEQADEIVSKFPAITNFDLTASTGIITFTQTTAGAGTISVVSFTAAATP